VADVGEQPRAPKPRRRRRRRRLSRQQEQRRRILRAGLAMAGLLLLHPLAVVPLVRSLRTRLRPPGALDEHEFLAACIKCGQCVQVCPVQAIELADMDEGFGTGVPFIEARRQACDFSCDALSCILACPTGALSHDLASKEEVQAGLARLVRPERCLARKGEGIRGPARGPHFRGRLRYAEVDRWHPIPVRRHAYDREPCDLCVLECPIGDSAIALVPFESADGRVTHTPEVRDGCVGCGVCEMICPPDPAAIEIEPRATPPLRLLSGDA
jgi:ferredoxin-type protein NapG